MRTLRFLLPLSAVAALVVAASSSTAVAGSRTACSGSLGGDYWSDIFATNVSCSDATSLIKKWIKASGWRLHHKPKSRVTVGDFSCKVSFPEAGIGFLRCTASNSRLVTTRGM